MEFKFIPKSKTQSLPITAGVYAFKSESNVLLYIGKAVNIRERVKNHFSQPTFKDNVFIPATEKIGYIATGSEIEALILEAELIKKYQPKYNTQWKDSKNYSYVAITNEEFPKVFVTHQPKNWKSETRITKKYQIPKPKYSHKLDIGDLSIFSDFGIRNSGFCFIGPFVDGKALKQTLRMLRRVFPYRTCRILPKKPCLYKELGLCPAPCEKNLKSQILNLKKEYKKNIKNLIAILQGRKTRVLKNMQKEMNVASQRQDFEKAKVLRDQIWALENVFSHSRIFQKEMPRPVNWPKTEKELQILLGMKTKINRIEGYDISNIQGKQATGSMVVFENGQPNKNEYRKFKMKIAGKPNDTAMLQEMISRRLKHSEWPMPQVMLIDGGIAQLNAAISCLGADLPRIGPKLSGGLPPNPNMLKIVALAKKKNELFIEGQKKPVLLKDLPQEIANLILQIRDEAHRFAIAYHKKLRSKSFLG